MKKIYCGIDIGSASIKAVLYDEEENVILQTVCVKHLGNVLKTLNQLLLSLKLSLDDVLFRFTGCNAKNFIPSKYILEEIPAIELGARFLYPDVRSVIEIGSEHARYITNICDNKIPQFSINESCAGGTGSFFESQTNRLGLDIDDYSDIVKKADSEVRMSGKCAVFAKTDIIHKQQEGVSVPNILLGLCYATIRNIKTTIIKGLPIEKPICLAGGVAKNYGVRIATKDVFGLNENDFYCDENTVFVGSIGCAICHDEDNLMEYSELQQVLNSRLIEQENKRKHFLKPLVLHTNSSLKDTKTKKLVIEDDYYLGIDVGSTSVNLVLIGNDNEIYDSQYLRTKGEPKKVVQEGINNLYKKYGTSLNIVSSGVTGSGRYLISKMINADQTIDEITSQAKCASFYDNEVDTVFEIGGQDSKFISLNNGDVIDFTMNRICAAGTGSFIEEQSIEMNIDINDYGRIALSSKKPIDLGDRCTVFIKSAIDYYLAKGTDKEDILAGLCYSIVLNYLHKVVENRHIGNKICLQGGICYNPATVAAFEAFYGDKIVVNPYFSISGAYGVALLTKEKHANKCVGGDIHQKIDNEKNNKFSNNKSSDVQTLSSEKKNVIIPLCLHNTHMFKAWKKLFENLGFNVIVVKTNDNIVDLAKDTAVNDICFPIKLIYGHFAYIKNKFPKADFVFLPTIIEQKEKDSDKGHKNYGCEYMQSLPQIIYDDLKLSESGIKFVSPRFYMFDHKFSLKKEIKRCLKLMGCNKEQIEKGPEMFMEMKAKQKEQQKEKSKEIRKMINQSNKKCIALICRPYDMNDPVLNMGITKEFEKRGYRVIPQGMINSVYDITDSYHNVYWPFAKHILGAARFVAKTPNIYACYITNHGCGPDGLLLHLFEKEMGNKQYLNIEVDEHVSKVGIITRIEAFINSIESHEPQVYNQLNNDNNITTLDSLSNLKVTNKTYLPNYGVYSTIYKKLIDNDKFEIFPKSTKETINYGKEETLSKEYLSFVNDIGIVKEIMTDNPQKDHNIILFESNGSNPQGFYPSIIREKYNSKKLNIFTLKPKSLINDPTIISTLIYGDLIMSLPKSLRSKGLEIINKDTNLDSLTSRIQEIKGESNKKSIVVIGEPQIVYNEYLNNYLEDYLESKGFDVEYMSLTEYVYYLSKENKCLAEKDIQLIKDIYPLLFKNNVSRILNDINQRYENEYSNVISGGNIAYLNKLINAVQDKPMIYVSSLYENTSILLSLMNKNISSPMLYLGYESSNNEEIREKLDSFIYYLK